MKFAITLYLLFCIVSFNACKKDKPDERDTRKTLLAKMTNSSGSFVYEYDQQNRLISETFYRQATPTVMDYKETYSDFNAAGLPVKITITGDETVASGTAEYDGQNRVTKITYRSTAGVAVSSQNFAYGSNSIDCSTRNEQTGAVFARTVYTFNPQGNIVSYDIYGTAGSVVQRVVNKSFDDKKSAKEFYNPLTGIYSVNNETASEITLISSGQVFPFTRSIEYSSDGYITKAIAKNLSSGAESTTTYEYVKR